MWGKREGGLSESDISGARPITTVVCAKDVCVCCCSSFVIPTFSLLLALSLGIHHLVNYPLIVCVPLPSVHRTLRRFGFAQRRLQSESHHLISPVQPDPTPQCPTSRLGLRNPASPGKQSPARCSSRRGGRMSPARVKLWSPRRTLHHRSWGR